MCKDNSPTQRQQHGRKAWCTHLHCAAAQLVEVAVAHAEHLAVQDDDLWAGTQKWGGHTRARIVTGEGAGRRSTWSAWKTDMMMRTMIARGMYTFHIDVGMNAMPARG
jgi:hypothetical protein